MLSQLYAKEKRLDDAISAVRQAIELNPNSAIYYDRLSQYLENQGQSEESIEALRQADRLSPNSGQYLFKLAFLGEQQGTERAAVMDLLRQAIKKEPNNPRYRFSLAGFLGKENRYEECLAELREVVRLGAGTQWEQMARRMIEKTESERDSQPKE